MNARLHHARAIFPDVVLGIDLVFKRHIDETETPCADVIACLQDSMIDENCLLPTSSLISAMYATSSEDDDADEYENAAEQPGLINDV